MTTTNQAAQPGLITKEQAQTVLRRNVQNLIEKVKAGRPLKASEMALVEALADGRAESSEFVWAQNQQQLADVLGVSRKTIQRWRKDGAPPPQHDSRYYVPAWRAWMAANAKTSDEADHDDGSDHLREEQRRRITLQIERLEHELGALKGEFTANSELKAQKRDFCIEVAAVLNPLPDALAPQVVGLTVPEAAKRMRDAVDDALLRLHTGTASSA